jgi:adenylate kinase
MTVMKLAILGAPGSGKGTQAEMISNKFSLKHVSIGELLRENINLKTKIGMNVSELVSSGNLVPDKVIVELLKKNLPINNFILDGCPRSVGQAVSLDEIGVEIENIILLEISDEIAIERLNGRLICPKCGAVYHKIYNAPEQYGICNICKTKLTQRKDDKLNVILDRLSFYRKSIEEILNFYINIKNFSKILINDNHSSSIKTNLAKKIFCFDASKNTNDVYKDISNILLNEV